MHPLAALLAACALYVGALPAVMFDYEKHVVVSVASSSATAQIGGELICNAGKPTIYLYRVPSWVDITEIITHEALHGVQCAYDGAIGRGAFALDPTACGRYPTDCQHSWVYWALEHPEAAARIIGALR